MHSRTGSAFNGTLLVYGLELLVQDLGFTFPVSPSLLSNIFRTSVRIMGNEMKDLTDIIAVARDYINMVDIRR